MQRRGSDGSPELPTHTCMCTRCKITVHVALTYLPFFTISFLVEGQFFLLLEVQPYLSTLLRDTVYFWIVPKSRSL